MAEEEEEFELDADACADVLQEWIPGNAREVFSNSCLLTDGYGSGVSSVYEFAERYWAVRIEGEFLGPFDDIEEAIRAAYAHWVTPDGEIAIKSRVLPADEVVGLLYVPEAPEDLPRRFTINRAGYQVGLDGEIRKIRAARKRG